MCLHVVTEVVTSLLGVHNNQLLYIITTILSLLYIIVDKVYCLTYTKKASPGDDGGHDTNE